MALENKIKELAESGFSSPGYHRFLNDGKLMGSKCRQCGEINVPPRPVCLKCKSSEMELAQMSGKGKLAAYTVINVAPPLMVKRGFGKGKPYCSGVVQLEEGAKVSAQILGLDLSRPEEIRIGTPLEMELVEFEQEEEKKTYLAFRAADQ